MLELHFLNVGHGDCTYLKHVSGRLTMVDVNNSNTLPEEDKAALAFAKGLTREAFAEARPAGTYYRSWEDYYQSLLVDPYEYYSNHFAGESIFRYIQTHPDMDHMSGLHRFFFQEKVPLLNFWDTEHKKEFSETDFTSSPYDFLDWLAYKILRLGGGPDDNTHKVLHELQGAVGSFWVEDGIQILGPTKTLVEVCNILEDWNNSSFVLKVTYAGRSVVLPGDAENTEWETICDAVDEADLKCDILKAAHHGRTSGYSKRATDIMNPSIVICSVGKKPDTDASDEYAAHGATVLSTRYHGSIKIQMWYDGEVWVYDEAGSRIASIPPH